MSRSVNGEDRWPRRMSGYEAMIEEVRFAEDSPLEEAGFEPSVPRETTNL
jgi:hypothetical protein